MARPKGSLNQTHKRYTVYNNYTDELVILDGDAYECAAALGITVKGFRELVCNVRRGVLRKWVILTEEELSDDE